MRVVFCLAVSIALIAAARAAPLPRDSVGDIAKAIEDNYFDLARGKAIADDLRKDAAAGTFDSLADTDALAETLTERLRPLDGHFHVSWTGPRSERPHEAGSDAPPPLGPKTHGPAPHGPAGPPQPRPDFGDILSRHNNGFPRIERLPGNIALIEMAGFARIDFDKADDPARASVDAALTSARGADAVIVDLRKTPGGDPTMVGYFASAFLAKGANPYNVFNSREGTESEAPKKPYARPNPAVPLYILTSGRTGSAAEAFAYTLQAAKRATIVGEHSAGAANPGGDVPTPSGFSVFVPVATPINPITNGNWEKIGVIPDAPCVAGDALIQAQIRALKTIAAKAAASSENQEAAWALDYLQAIEVAFAAADYVGSYDDMTITSADGTLTSARPGRPVLKLKAIAADIFSPVDEPTVRIQFSRNAAGKVDGLDFLTAFGDRMHHPRSS